MPLREEGISKVRDLMPVIYGEGERADKHAGWCGGGAWWRDRGEGRERKGRYLRSESRGFFSGTEEL